MLSDLFGWHREIIILRIITIILFALVRAALVVRDLSSLSLWVTSRCHCRTGGHDLLVDSLTRAAVVGKEEEEEEEEEEECLQRGALSRRGPS